MKSATLSYCQKPEYLKNLAVYFICLWKIKGSSYINSEKRGLSYISQAKELGLLCVVVAQC